jgi:hypothetical protein
MSDTLAPRCAGGCGRDLSDGGAGWLVLLGVMGQPRYFFCPDCEQEKADWIERQLSEEGEAAGCTAMVRLQSGTPAEVLGMVRDITT